MKSILLFCIIGMILSGLLYTSCKEPELTTISEVKTDTIINVIFHSVTAVGTIIDLGVGGEITYYGHCWSLTNPNPTLEYDNLNLGSTTKTGRFECNITRLDSARTYYIRAFATNDAGTSYGESLIFKTDPIPLVKTGTYRNVTHNSAIVSGTISNLGATKHVIQYGHCYSRYSPNPYLWNSDKTEFGSTDTTGIFESELIDLDIGATYFVRSYASDIYDTRYGEVISFKTATMEMIVNTTSIGLIDYNIVICSGEVSIDQDISILERGILWSKYPFSTLQNCDGSINTGAGEGSFTVNIENLDYETTYFVKAYSKNYLHTVYGNELNITTLSRCYSTPYVMDADGIEYNTIKIGNQCWMKENLKVGIMITTNNQASNNGTIEKMCYDNEIENCDEYGGLYTWDEMMQYSLSDNNNSGITQGICPNGWHIPGDEEWYELTDFIDGAIIAGGKMKEQGTLHWNEPNVEATNSSGFTAVPAGLYSIDSSFNFISRNANLWSSYQLGDIEAWSRVLYYSNENVGRYPSNKGSALSVRCIKN